LMRLRAPWSRTTVTLLPHTTRAAAGRVRLSRFPALTKLNLIDWTTVAIRDLDYPSDPSSIARDAALLHSLFLEGRRLETVTTLDLDFPFGEACCVSVDLPLIFPELQHCVIGSNTVQKGFDVPLAGLKQQQSVGFNHADMLSHIDWDGLASLTSLTALACVLDDAEVCQDSCPQIKRLTHLHTLELRLQSGLDSDDFDVTGVFEMTTSMPIHTLYITFERLEYGDEEYGTLSSDGRACAKFARDPPPSPRALSLVHANELSLVGMHALSVSDVALLTMNTNLRQLKVACEEEDRAEAEWLGREARAKGGAQVKVTQRWEAAQCGGAPFSFLLVRGGMIPSSALGA
jgi:hypothetical protein